MADTAYDGFQRKIDDVHDNACNEATFFALSQQAVRLYRDNPSWGEKIAGQMTDLWYHNQSRWCDERAGQIGELFADLDVPPSQVSGGEDAARAKWRTIGDLLHSSGQADRPPDRYK